MLNISDRTPKTVLVNLYNYFRIKKEDLEYRMEMHGEKYEMGMYRDTLAGTKYKTVWEEYREFNKHHSQIQENQMKIQHYLRKINNCDKNERS